MLSILQALKDLDCFSPPSSHLQVLQPRRKDMPSTKVASQTRPEASAAASKCSRNRSKASCGNCYRRKQKVRQTLRAVFSEGSCRDAGRSSFIGANASKRQNLLLGPGSTSIVNEAGSISLCLQLKACNVHTDHFSNLVRPEVAMQSLLGPQSGLHLSFFHPRQRLWTCGESNSELKGEPSDPTAATEAKPTGVCSSMLLVFVP